MGNKKPPKKAPPNADLVKNVKINKPEPILPKEILNMEEKDIGKTASIMEASSNQPTSDPKDTVASQKQDVALEATRIGCIVDPSTQDEGLTRDVDPKNTSTEERVETSQQPKSSWADLVKGTAKKLRKRGEAFTLESGESCIRIPNSVIERHKKDWDCFVLGQFYSNPPSHGTIHNIVNGIWSRQYRDIAVSKMGNQSFLFRIPNAVTRQRVLTQSLWQIEGRTMFVAKWEPGSSQEKPELTSAPIWLELRDVPLPYFNEEGLEYIASLVGEPKFLHPTTENKTNLEVAKVFTVIDPRKSLPEAVNVQYESGEIKRIRVSSPWMPPVCGFCNEVGHSLKHCKDAPRKCTVCDSTIHEVEDCPRRRSKDAKTSASKVSSEKRQPQKQSPQLTLDQGTENSSKEWIVKQKQQEPDHPVLDKGKGIAQSAPNPKSKVFEPKPQEKLVLGGNSASKSQKQVIAKQKRVAPTSGGKSSSSEDSEDSRDDDSSDRSVSALEEGEFQRFLSQRQRKASRGKGLKLNH